MGMVLGDCVKFKMGGFKRVTVMYYGTYKVRTQGREREVLRLSGEEQEQGNEGKRT